MTDLKERAKKIYSQLPDRLYQEKFIELVSNALQATRKEALEEAAKVADSGHIAREALNPKEKL